MKRARVGILGLVLLTVAACGGHSSTAPPPDQFRWLEDVNSPRAQAWVAAENKKTLDVLTKDPHFADNLAQATAVGNSTDRIPVPAIINGQVYNFWQDATHQRGIWRTTSVADFETPRPHWTTVLDLDALAATEHKNWVWEGANCSPVTQTHCLIQLSEGGEDAQTLREFDLATNTFVENGFVLPRGKQNATWVDDNTLLVSREWHDGDLTSSGYPFIVKSWHRGQPLDAATEVGRGQRTDVSADPVELDDGAGKELTMIDRNPSFFDHEYHLITPTGTPTLALPAQSAPVAMLAGRVVAQLNEDWTTAGQSFKAGSLVALDATALAADPGHLKATLIYAPGPLDTLQSVAASKDRLIITTLHNVSGRVTVYTPQPDGGWTGRPIAMPDNSTLEVPTADQHGDLAYATVTSFLSPPTLWHLDPDAGTATSAKAMPAMFDSSQDVVEQQEATSADGTKIPYFVVHAANMKLDGTNPTILYAYGGFGNSETPFYSGTLGRLWLQHGGVYVLANIRGGGEFGPAWHNAALTVHRQRAFDDFAAVGKDLVTRRITTPRHLGIEGGSNGGLLMGVEFTQHPEMWNAVDMQVPLLDMMRYEQIEAGASWVGEYGSVNVPAQRDFLASISPYQNLKRGVRYPEPFIWTTTKDDRVGPQHARKFAAELSSYGDPYLFYEVAEGGHGSGANIDERANTSALEYTYFTRRLTD